MKEMFWIVIGVSIAVAGLYVKLRPIINSTILNRTRPGRALPAAPFDPGDVDAVARKSDLQSLRKMASQSRENWDAEGYGKILDTLVSLDASTRKEGAAATVENLSKPFDAATLRKIASASKRIESDASDSEAWLDLGDCFLSASLYNDAKTIFDRILIDTKDDRLREEASRRIQSLGKLASIEIS